MKDNINRISKMIFKLITSIEEEFDELEHSDRKERIKHKKVIAASLAKLVQLTVQLQRVSGNDVEGGNVLPEEDIQIIENFLQMSKSSDDDR